MGVTSVWLRGTLRRQGVGLVLLGVVLGLGLGFVLVAAQGARRADSAYDRLRTRTLGPDLLTDASGMTDDSFAELAGLPGVDAAGRFAYTPVAPTPLQPGVDAGAFVGLDDAFLDTVYRPLVLEGRLPRPGATDEVLANELLAERAGVHAGDRVRLQSGFEDPTPVGQAQVVGVVRGLFDVGANAGNPALLLPRSFLAGHADAVPVGPAPAALVRLHDAEADAPAFQEAAEAIAGHPLQFLAAGEEGGGIEKTLRVQGLAFALLAGAAGLATLLAGFQGLGRQLSSALVDLPVLVAIGLRPRQRIALGGALAVPLIATSAVVGAVVGVAGSTFVPTGLARAVDPASGVQVDLVVLSVGLIGWAVLLAAAGLVSSGRIHARRAAFTPRPGRTTTLLRRLPLRARLGCELSLAPSTAPAGAAARSALVAMTFAVAAVVGVGIFAGSLHRLVDDGHLELAGWDFDAAVVAEADGDLATFRAAVLDATGGDRPAAAAFATITQLSVAGSVVEAYAFDPDAGAVHPTMRAGRPPLAEGEVALGADAARRAHVGVGDRVELSGPEGRMAARVVGIATYPELGTNGDISNAASLTASTAEELGAEGAWRVAMLRFPAPPDEALQGTLSELGEVVLPFRPPRLLQLEEVGALPAVLATFLALLGLAATGHGLLRAGRDRRRDFSVLRSLGFRPRDVRATVIWQGVTTGLASSGVGLLAGLVIGSWVWTRVVDDIGAVVEVVRYVPMLVAAAPASVALGALLGLGPGWRASRRPPALDLRPE